MAYTLETLEQVAATLGVDFEDVQRRIASYNNDPIYARSDLHWFETIADLALAAGTLTTEDAWAFIASKGAVRSQAAYDAIKSWRESDSAE